MAAEEEDSHPFPKEDVRIQLRRSHPLLFNLWLPRNLCHQLFPLKELDCVSGRRARAKEQDIGDKSSSEAINKSGATQTINKSRESRTFINSRESRTLIINH
ncbi:hypothetical protein LWI29_031948 [Acer saccharum]|uniref:Uncharacterized protein n=1 Tax=Acer saccharum TaxID=4024 RepID=A0AA39S8X9_ACESA|nr:hypothetical protein LWI29_031948 [Acer saccharum]